MKLHLPLKRSLIAIVILIVLGLFPHLVAPYWISISIRTFWLVFLCVAWTIATRANAVNLCHMTFVGLGGYTSTLLFLNAGVSPWLGALAGMAIALAVALFIGWICFRGRLGGLSFIVITLAFSMIILFAAQVLDWTGGNTGLFIMPADDSWNFQWLSKLPYYYIILIMTFAIVAIHRLIDRSKLGLYFKAIADNERAAAGIGINVMRYKLIALGISAVLAALAGTFWAQYTTYVEPQGFLGFDTMLMVMIFVAIGGSTSSWGAVVAPLVLTPLLDIFRAELGSRYAGSAWILYGVLVVLVMLLLPRGVMTWIEERFKTAPSPPPEPDIKSSS